MQKLQNISKLLDSDEIRRGRNKTCGLCFPNLSRNVDGLVRLL